MPIWIWEKEYNPEVEKRYYEQQTLERAEEEKKKRREELQRRAEEYRREGEKEERFLKMPWYKQILTKRVVREIPPAAIEAGRKAPSFIYREVVKPTAKDIATLGKAYISQKARIPGLPAPLIKPPSPQEVIPAALRTGAMIAPIPKVGFISKLLPKGVIGKIATRGIRTGVPGLLYGAGEAIEKKEKLPKALKTIAQTGALWGGFGVAGETAALLRKALRGKAISPKLAEILPKPTKPKVLPTIKPSLIFKTGEKNFQQFNAKTNQSIITLRKDAKADIIWHETAHALDRQNPNLRLQLAPEIRNITGSQSQIITNENFATAFKSLVQNPELKQNAPQLTKIMQDIKFPENIQKKLLKPFKISEKVSPIPIPEEHFLKPEAARIYEELSVAQAGERIPIRREIGGEITKIIKKPSTFPQWVPQELRSKPLFDKVQKHLIENTLPKNKKEIELYNVIGEEVRYRLGIPKVEGIAKEITPIIPTAPAVPIPEGFTISKYYKGKAVTRYARPIKAQNINTVEDIQQLNQDLNTKYTKLFQDIKGGRKPNEVTLKEAENLGWDYNTIKQIPDNALLSDAQTAAVSQIKADFTLELAERAKLYQKSPTNALLGELNDLVSKILHVDAVTKRSEIYLGRAIQIKQATPIPREFDSSIMDILNKANITGATDLKSALKVSQKLTQASIQDIIWSGYYASILSGTTTHARNIRSTALMTAAEQMLEAIRHPVNIPSQLKAIKTGAGEGIRAFRDIMAGRVEWKSKFDISRPSIKNWLISKFEYVGRLLAAEDAFFRKINERSALSSLAYEKARKEGFGLFRARQVAQQYIKNPTPKMAAQAVKESLRNTYNQPPEGIVGAITNSWGRMIKKFPLLRPIQPFAKVVGNVLNAGIDWSPGGYLSIFTRGMPRAPGEFAKRELHQQIGRATIGTMGMIFAYTFALDGSITGSGPKNPNLRQELYRQGWQANSIKIGNKYRSYLDFGPFAIPLAIISNFAEAKKYGQLEDKESEERLAYAVFGSLDTIMDMSFIQNIGRLQDAIQNPAMAWKWMQRTVANVATTPYPNLLKQIGNLFEDTKKDPQSFMEQLRYSMGYPFRKEVPPRLDVFGEPVQDVRPFLSRILGTSVIREREEELSPLLTKLTSENISLSIPTKTTKLKDEEGEGRTMTTEELRQYRQIFGQKLKERLLLDQPILLDLSGEELEDEIKSIIKRIHQETKDEMPTNY